jgi:Polyketide cyclase / dehydrase and lipid transport
MQVVQKFITPAHTEAVWQVLADVEHWRDWTPTVVEIKSLGSQGLTVGARYRVVQPKLRPAIYEVTECVPNQAFTWVQKLPGGGMIADHRLSNRDGATEVELSFTSKGTFANLVGKIFSKLISDYVATEAKSLKSRCDSLASQGEY